MSDTSQMLLDQSILDISPSLWTGIAGPFCSCGGCGHRLTFNQTCKHENTHSSGIQLLYTTMLHVWKPPGEIIILLVVRDVLMETWVSLVKQQLTGRGGPGLRTDSDCSLTSTSSNGMDWEVCVPSQRGTPLGVPPAINPGRDPRKGINLTCY